MRVFMKEYRMSPSCPISQKRVDTNLVRVVSFQVLIFALLFAVTQVTLFMVIVLADMIARVFRKDAYSVFTKVAAYILKQWNVEPLYTDESPKRFALYLGLTIAFLVLLLSLGGFVKTAAAVALILVICAFLEVLFDFCIGCKLYYTLQLFKAIRNDRYLN